MENKKTGIVLADIHLGALPIPRTYEEMRFLKKSFKNNHYSFIIIAGDLFDRKLYSNEPYITIAIDLMDFLLSRCEKLRIIEGTKSHDNGQYSIFEIYENRTSEMINSDNIDLKVIKFVEEEELFPGMNVLYIPEEYIFDKKNYYKEYFCKENYYDYVFGHGVIQEAMSNAVRNMKKDDSKRKKSPVFTTGELRKITKGEVYFGHYHAHTVMGNVRYVGSFSRYKFGEEEEKGYYTISTDGEKFDSRFIENISTESYLSISYGYKSSLFFDETDIIEEFNAIKIRKKKTGIDHLKLIFNIPDDYKNAEFFINVLNDTFRDRPDIKIDIVNGYISAKRNVNKEELKEVIENYDYLFDPNNKIEDNISTFIHDKYKKDIDPKKVKLYLERNAIELLNEEKLE